MTWAVGATQNLKYADDDESKKIRFDPVSVISPRRLHFKILNLNISRTNWLIDVSNSCFQIMEAGHFYYNIYVEIEFVVSKFLVLSVDIGFSAKLC